MLDVLDGTGNAVHQFYRNDGFEIFGAPVFFRGRGGEREKGAHFVGGADGAASAMQRFQNRHEMGVGDRLIPAPPPAVRNYVPHAPRTNIDARVMSIYSGVTYAGQSQVVTVNRGSIDGLDVGSVLQLYHFGKVVADPEGNKGFFGLKRATMKLPDEQYGSLFIFRVFGRVSYGLIMQVTAPVEVGDVAKSPE